MNLIYTPELSSLVNFLLIISFPVIISSISLNYLFIKIAKRFDITDKPSSAPNRKTQKNAIPLIGFTGSFIIVTLILFLIYLDTSYNIFGFKDLWTTNLIFNFNAFNILIGSVMIYIFGVLDDIYTLKPKVYFPLLFISLLFIVLGGNIKIEAFSYPFNWINFENNPISYFIAFIWLGVCMSSTKFLDGHDGLVTSVGAISFGVVAVVASLFNVNQPLIIFISIIYLIGCLGFLPFNLPNAKAYLGEGGSTNIGLWIGILSILSGAKVATIFSVLGWFIIDIIFVLIFRYKKGGFRNILVGDSSLHWHHRLKRLGLGKWQVLLISVFLILISSGFGLFLPAVYKLVFLVFQIVLVWASFLLVEKFK